MTRHILTTCLAVCVGHLSATNFPLLISQQDGTRMPKGTKEARALCSRIREIKKLPFRNDGPDANYQEYGEVYAQLRKVGDDAVPCLIEKITDTRKMPDPRQAPTVGSVAIGDVAFWILNDITKLPYDDMFPSEVRQRFKDEGVYVYFEWIAKKKNRSLLQRNIRSWYLSEHSKGRR